MPRCTTRWLPESSPMTRFLPSRPTDLTVVPSSRARNSFTDLCRRVSLPLVTVTALIFLPVSSRESTERTVSTSGSSGIASLPCGPRRGELGHLLGRPLAGADDLAGDPDGRGVAPLVARPVAGDLVARGAEAPGLGPLLEPALRVGGARVTRLGAEPLVERARAPGARAALEAPARGRPRRRRPRRRRRAASRGRGRRSPPRRARGAAPRRDRARGTASASEGSDTVAWRTWARPPSGRSSSR